jgi:DNA-binding MarR family transcriptional regulator
VNPAVKLDHPAPETTGSLAWELMYQVFKSSKPYMETIASAFDMTPQQVYALKQLSPDRPSTMSELATMLGCDASNVTSLVDRLESRGFVERRAADRDRRVKALLLTSAGQELKGRIAERMQVPPPAIANLSVADQEALSAILTRALDSL